MCVCVFGALRFFIQVFLLMRLVSFSGFGDQSLVLLRCLGSS